MQRKVNQIGPSTLMVSLPSKWAKKHNVKKGDALEVEEKESQLMISALNALQKGKKLTIDLDNLNTSVVWYYLTTAYRSGADEIHVFFTKKAIKDDARDKEIELQSFLRLVVEGFIGMEIVRNTTTSVEIKEISTIKEEEYAVIFRRIFYSIIVTFDDIIKSSAMKDKSSLQHIFSHADTQINKFVDYCIRIHAKTNTHPVAEYAVILNLEEVGDSLKHLANLLTIKQSGKEVDDALQGLKELFVTLENFYFTGSKDKLVSFESQKRSIRRMLGAFPKQQDLRILMVLTNILNQSLSILYSRLLITHQDKAS